MDYLPALELDLFQNYLYYSACSLEMFFFGGQGNFSNVNFNWVKIILVKIADSSLHRARVFKATLLIC